MSFRLPRAAGAARVLRAASFGAAFAAGALSACAAPSVGPAVAGGGIRVLVKLVRPSQDPAAIAAEATRLAGVAATYAAAMSTAWHALNLGCADAPTCEAAITRLRQASGTYEVVEREGRARAM